MRVEELTGRVLVDTENSIFVPTYRRRVGLVAISPVLRPAQLVQQPRQIVVASEAGEVLRMGV